MSDTRSISDLPALPGFKFRKLRQRLGPRFELERWDFSWYEDLFAKDAGPPSVVNVASRIYRKLALYEPGN
ncbi:hypothetical protein F4820DRAFT_445037 [Hypoxylon rubiginosum]|uniref:Uncharacterized protein n=1 Tax=Hypoxylon rubiginosum TaxID=110542 RepID=A0ACB9Z9D3_9PEZI|nr:hypothetical protein F4820DRAFT_445037 [Hypoxylon rubiginosum]